MTFEPCEDAFLDFIQEPWRSSECPEESPWMRFTSACEGELRTHSFDRLFKRYDTVKHELSGLIRTSTDIELVKWKSSVLHSVESELYERFTSADICEIWNSSLKQSITSAPHFDSPQVEQYKQTFWSIVSAKLIRDEIFSFFIRFTNDLNEIRARFQFCDDVVSRYNIDENQYSDNFISIHTIPKSRIMFIDQILDVVNLRGANLMPMDQIAAFIRSARLSEVSTVLYSILRRMLISNSVSMSIAAFLHSVFTKESSEDFALLHGYFRTLATMLKDFNDLDLYMWHEDGSIRCDLKIFISEMETLELRIRKEYENSETNLEQLTQRLRAISVTCRSDELQQFHLHDLERVKEAKGDPCPTSIWQYVHNGFRGVLFRVAEVMHKEFLA